MCVLGDLGWILNYLTKIFVVGCRVDESVTWNFNDFEFSIQSVCYSGNCNTNFLGCGGQWNHHTRKQNLILIIIIINYH